MTDQSSRHAALVESVVHEIDLRRHKKTFSGAAIARAVLALIAERMKEVSEEQAEAWSLASAILTSGMPDQAANMATAKSDWLAMLSGSALTPGDGGMRVLVCGGRKYNDYFKIYHTLDDIQDERGPINAIIEGGQTGADYWAESWAWMNRGRVEHRKFVAEWKRLGKSAGPIRNQRMLDEGKPDLVVAFPGNSGTANMVKLAKKAGVEVITVEARP